LKKKKLLERRSLREKSLLLPVVFDLSASEEGVVFDALLPEVFALVSTVEYEFNRLFVILLKMPYFKKFVEKTRTYASG